MKHSVVYILFLSITIAHAIYPSTAPTNTEKFNHALGQARRASTAAIDPMARSTHSLSGARGSQRHVVFRGFSSDDTHSDTYDKVAATATPEENDGQYQPGQELHRTSSDLAMSASTLLAKPAVTDDLSVQTPTPKQRLRDCIDKARAGLIRPLNISFATESSPSRSQTRPQTASPLIASRAASGSADNSANNSARNASSNSSNSSDDSLVPMRIIAAVATKDQTTQVAVKRSSKSLLSAPTYSWQTTYLPCIATGISTATVTGLIMQYLRPQKPPTRMMTGYEIPAAINGLGMVGSAMCIAGSGLAGWFVFSRFQEWVHSACHTKQELLKNSFEETVKNLEKKFTAKLSDHKKEVHTALVDMSEQINIGFARERDDFNAIITPVISALEHAGELLEPTPSAQGSPSTTNQHAAAETLHKAAALARTQQEEHTSPIIVPPKPPKENTRCCC